MCCRPLFLAPLSLPAAVRWGASRHLQYVKNAWQEWLCTAWVWAASCLQFCSCSLTFFSPLTICVHIHGCVCVHVFLCMHDGLPSPGHCQRNCRRGTFNSVSLWISREWQLCVCVHVCVHMSLYVSVCLLWVIDQIFCLQRFRALPSIGPPTPALAPPLWVKQAPEWSTSCGGLGTFTHWPLL